MQNIIDKIKRFILDNNLFEDQNKLIVAFSGGPDSLFLAVILKKLKENYFKNIKIYLAYYNHNLRKDSFIEEKKVEKMAEKLNLPILYGGGNVLEFSNKNHISIEMAARKLRYDFLYDVLNKKKGDFIVTAHHLDDLVETIFLHIIRGSGINGLIGLKPKNKKIIRPLLEIEKKEIYEFLKKHKLDFVIDYTNYENICERNILRNKIIPLIKDIKPNFVKNMLRLSNNLSGINSFLIYEFEKYLKILSPTKSDLGFCFKKDFFYSIHPEIIREFLRYILIEKIGIKDKYITQKKILDIKDLIFKSGGKIIEISDNFKVESSNKYIFIFFFNKLETWEAFRLKCDEEFIIPVFNINGRCFIGKPGNEENRMYLSIDVNFPLIFKIGNLKDKVFIGVNKTLKKLFQESGVSKTLRRIWPVLYDRYGEILWIPGIYKKKFNLSENYFVIELEEVPFGIKK